MIELENPQIEPVEEAGTYAKYEAGPLQAGYGVTLGNALRRVLLSSLEGAAVTSIQIRDVYQEFSTIPGVKEDVTQIVLNVKKLRLKSYATHPVQLRLIKSGAGAVTAADIAESADVEIVNPDLVLMTLDTDDVTIEMDLTVERGVGYLGAERAEALPIGVIAVDAIFTPVRKVNYWVEGMRVGQMTNYDKLTIEIETDGTITPEEALSRSAEILVNQFRPFVTIGMAGRPRSPPRPAPPQLPPNMLDMPIEELDLPMRAYNSLKRNNIVKVGQLLQLKDDDLLRMRNFGKKSLDEMKERLRMRGFIVPDTETDGLDDVEGDEPFDDEAEGLTGVLHRIGGRKLSRKQGPRLALFKNLTVSVLRYERVKTTEAKAKEISGRVEKMITLAKRGDRSSMPSSTRLWHSMRKLPRIIIRTLLQREYTVLSSLSLDKFIHIAAPRKLRQDVLIAESYSTGYTRIVCGLDVTSLCRAIRQWSGLLFTFEDAVVFENRSRAKPNRPD